MTNIYDRAVRALVPVLGHGLDYCCRPGCGHLACRVVHALDDADLIAYADVQAVRGALDDAEAAEEYGHSRAKEDRRNGLGEDAPPEDPAAVVEALVLALRLQRAAWQVVRVWESGVRQPPAPRLGRALRELHRALRGHEAKAVD